MNTDNLESRGKLINKGVVYFPRTGEWEKIQAEKIFFNRKVMVADTDEWFEFHLEFSKKYPEITLGLYQPGLARMGLAVIPILEINEQLQRVQLEWLTCKICAWYGATLNPMIPDLYFGIPNKFEEMRRVEIFPVLLCPKCNTKLPSHPIWTEPYFED